MGNRIEQLDKQCTIRESEAKINEIIEVLNSLMVLFEGDSEGWSQAFREFNERLNVLDNKLTDCHVGARSHTDVLKTVGRELEEFLKRIMALEDNKETYESISRTYKMYVDKDIQKNKERIEKLDNILRKHEEDIKQLKINKLKGKGLSFLYKELGKVAYAHSLGRISARDMMAQRNKYIERIKDIKEGK